MTEAVSRIAFRLATLSLLAVAACSDSSPPSNVRPGSDGDSTKASPASTFLGTLQSGPDITKCKGAITLLENSAERVKAPPLPADTLKALFEFARLDDADQAEIVRAEPSSNGLDPYYLAECLLLKDAARSLAVEKLPPLTQARVAFEWVCRQVYLDDRDLPPVPVWYILQRGAGSGLERAYVYLALLRQLRLDGCLIGPPEVADQRSSRPAEPIQVGPDFWAVGVRVGSEIHLFDPWRGRVLADSKSGEPATLKQAQADEKLTASWMGDKRPPSIPKPEDWKRAEIFLTAPASSMAPRMVALEKLLKDSFGATLAFDPLAARDRFQKEALSGRAPRFWNPNDDRFAPPSVLAYFLPIEEGGLDQTPKGGRLIDAYESHLVPWQQFPQLPLQRDGPFFNFLAEQFKQSLFQGFVLPKQTQRYKNDDEDIRFVPISGIRLAHGTMRDHVLRGQFTEATKQLMEVREESHKRSESLSQDSAQAK